MKAAITKGSIKLFRLFGINIQLHFSWWLVFALLSFNLSVSFFPNLCAGKLTEGFLATTVIPGCSSLGMGSYWLMGIIAALFLFLSVLLHELSHSLVAKLKKIKVDSITLFFFGGVASIHEDDLKPSSEFLMAIAGPLFSILLGLVFFMINHFANNGIVTAIMFYLYLINFMLAGFNLIPGFPLDGGRAFRAILHAYYKDLKKATRIAAAGGRFFGIFLIILGILSFFGGGWWLVILGGFLYFMAGVGYEQVVIREALIKIPVKELLSKDFLPVDAEMKFADFLKQQVNCGEEIFLVKSKNFSGILDLKELNKISPGVQKWIKVKQLAISLDKLSSLRENDTAYTAFKKFAEEKVNLLPVYKNSKLLGFVTQKIVTQRLVWSLKFGFDGRNNKSITSKLPKKSKNNKKQALS